MLIQQSPDIDQELIAKKAKLVDLVFVKFDMEAAFDLLDRRDRIERALLSVLKKCYTQYYNAFQNISRNTRFIYVHAYQSYVWNQAVTKRLEQFGTRVLEGDLVIRHEKADILDNECADEDAP
jgi:tRNA pseudouridine13 synthase